MYYKLEALPEFYSVLNLDTKKNGLKLYYLSECDATTHWSISILVMKAEPSADEIVSILNP